eukprot:gene9199-16338_t
MRVDDTYYTLNPRMKTRVSHSNNLIMQVDDTFLDSESEGEEESLSEQEKEAAEAIHIYKEKRKQQLREAAEKLETEHVAPASGSEAKAAGTAGEGTVGTSEECLKRRRGQVKDTTSGAGCACGDAGHKDNCNWEERHEAELQEGERKPKRRQKMLHDLSDVSSVAITATGTLDNYRFNSFMCDLLQEKSKDIFRCKGVLAVHGQGNQKFIFQGVHETICYGPADVPWKDDEPRINKMVFIGKSLDRKGNQMLIFQEVRETICYGPADVPWKDDEPRINKMVFIGKSLDRQVGDLLRVCSVCPGVSVHEQGNQMLIFQGVRETICYGPADVPWKDNEPRIKRQGKGLDRKKGEEVVASGVDGGDGSGVQWKDSAPKINMMKLMGKGMDSAPKINMMKLMGKGMDRWVVAFDGGGGDGGGVQWKDNAPKIKRMQLMGKYLNRKGLIEGFRTCVWVPLPEGWEEHEDPKSGMTYYVQKSDGKKSWQRPASIPETLLQSSQACTKQKGLPTRQVSSTNLGTKPV